MTRLEHKGRYQVTVYQMDGGSPGKARLGVESPTRTAPTRSPLPPCNCPDGES
jgi:hypothetical protein